MDIPSYLLGKQSGGGGTSDYSQLSNKPSINSVTLDGDKTSSDLSLQDTLVSGTNIKTINNTSLLGSGDITIGGGGSAVTIIDDNSYNNPLILSELEPGTYQFENMPLSNNLYYFYYKGTPEDDLNSSWIFPNHPIIYVTRNFSDTPNFQLFGYFDGNYDGAGYYNVRAFMKINSNTVGETSIQTPIQIPLFDPTNTTGFDSSTTQTLKNIEGTLTWVDD